MCTIGRSAQARGLRKLYAAELQGSRIRSSRGWGGGTVGSVNGSPS